MALAKPKIDDRFFFTGVTVFFMVFVLSGFARTFYLHAQFRLPAPSAFLQFHGALMTGWVALLLAQASLISLRQTAWHKRLGVLGVVYPLVVVPIGCLATLGAAQREVRAHSAVVLGQLNVLGLELTQLLLFAGLVGAGLWLRNRPDFHKRLMVVATVCILPNVIVRLAMLLPNQDLVTNFAILIVWTLLLLSVVAIDTLRNRRLHPAFGWGASIAVTAAYVAWAGSRTAIWDHFWTGVLA